MLTDKELAEFKRGPFQMIVLFLLREGDMYGYQINQELKRRSEGKFTVAESVLYTVLYRLEQKELISKRRESGVKKPKIFYHLEPSGERFLSDLLAAYASISQGVNGILHWSEKEDH